MFTRPLFFWDESKIRYFAKTVKQVKQVLATFP